MANPIRLSVDGNSGNIHLPVDNDHSETIGLRVETDKKNVKMSTEEIRVVNAVSPTIKAERNEEGISVTVHDLNGTQTVQVYDGEKGDQGPAGPQGPNGEAGFSPIATVSKSGTIATITITDSAGTTTTEVYDGQTGPQGEQGLKGEKGDDYVLTEEDKDDIAGMAAEKVELTDYVKKTDYATASSAGVVKVNDALGFVVKGGYLMTVPADANNIKNGTNGNKTLTPSHQHEATFYGLAKAAGADESDSELAFGTYTEAAKTAIRDMIGAASQEDIPDVPVQDVQIDGASIVQEGIAVIPTATSSNPGVVKAGNGLYMQGGSIHLNAAPEFILKRGDVTTAPVVSSNQHIGVFYGLTKAAGVDMASSANPVGEYTDEAKAAIQQMFDVPSTGDIPDTSIYATKADTVLDTTLSRGRKEGTTVGEGSFAFGANVEASGASSFAIGNNAAAKGNASFARGTYTKACGDSSTAEGTYINAIGDYSSASGSAATKSVRFTGEANSTVYTIPTFIPIGSVILNSNTQTGVSIVTQIEQIDTLWQVTLDNTLNADGPLTNTRRQVFIGAAIGMYSHIEGTNSIALGEVQHVEGRNNEPNNIYAHIIGNGFNSTQRSNAYAIDWDGTGHYAGDVYVHSNADSSGGTKLATIEDIPDVPVQDVQVNGVSVMQDGVANVPIAGSTTLGVARGYNNSGINIDSSGNVSLAVADSTKIKAATSTGSAIAPGKQHESTFYGLAKAAGDTTQSASNNAVGQYTDEAKAAIQTMLDVPAKADIPGVPVQDVQIDGVSILDQNGVANVPLAGSSSFGVVKVAGEAYGVMVSQTGQLYTAKPTDVQIRSGTNNFKPIVPSVQHASTFYGLARAAGDVTQLQSSNPVGTYTEEAKAAIRQMLDAPSTDDIPEVPVTDVQINGTSILQNGTANLPYASSNTFGVTAIGDGLQRSSANKIMISAASTSQTKAGLSAYYPITPSTEHSSTFYGLAKAAGADMASSSNPVGTYTDEAKTAIKSMIGVPTMDDIIAAVHDSYPAAEGVSF